MLRLGAVSADVARSEIKVRERFQITLPANVFRSRGVGVGQIVDVVRIADSHIAIYLSVALSWRDPTKWPDLVKRAEEFRPAGLADRARWRQRR